MAQLITDWATSDSFCRWITARKQFCDNYKYATVTTACIQLTSRDCVTSFLSTDMLSHQLSNNNITNIIINNHDRAVSLQHLCIFKLYVLYNSCIIITIITTKNSVPYLSM